MRKVLFSLFASVICSSVLFAGTYPAWWTNRNVVVTNHVNDYGAVNAGQLKWVATQAKAELDANLTGGSGTAVANRVASFSATNNFMAVNIGQVKYVASPFWDRLISAGYTNSYPWPAPSTNTHDFSVANVGQVKNAFNFDLSMLSNTNDLDGDGLANWKETGTGIFISPVNTGSNPNLADTDHDGILDGLEVANRTDPNNPDTTPPVIGIAFPVNNSELLCMP